MPCSPARLFACIAPPDPGPLRSCKILKILAFLSMLCAAAAHMAAALPCPMSRSNDGELGSSRSCIEMMFCCLSSSLFKFPAWLPLSELLACKGPALLWLAFDMGAAIACALLLCCLLERSWISQ